MSDCIFYPVSSGNFVPTLNPGQRYRHSFGDLRLSRGIKELGILMATGQTIVINQLSEEASEKSRFYKLLNNPYVEISELIDHSCELCPELVADKSLLCMLDTTSTSLVSRIKEKREESPSPGVVDDNRTPGFHLHACLIVEERRKHILGLGDVVLYDRPKNHLSGAQAKQARNQRAKLPLEQKESYVWPLAAANTQKRLQGAGQVTYVLDQGGDKYESLVELRNQTKGADFILRSKENRLAVNVLNGQQARLLTLLDEEKWEEERKVAIRALDHYSKTNGKRVIRQARVAKMKIRFIPVQLCQPAHLKDTGGYLDGVFSLIEVKEDDATVPQGETPIHWRLITTRSVEHIDQAWHIVACYQMRWFIEQLFRVYKKQGFNIERSQFKDPDAIKRQAILGIKAATEVLQLTMAREGQMFIPLETVFKEPEQTIVLQKLNEKLSGKTEKTTNPHPDNSLAWAVWLIARLGGWNGYEKQRPPGPITIHRGLKRFHGIIWANNLMNGP